MLIRVVQSPKHKSLSSIYYRERESHARGVNGEFICCNIYFRYEIVIVNKLYILHFVSDT